MEQTPEQKVPKEKSSQERIRSALYDVLKLIPEAAKETLNVQLSEMESELQKQLEEDKRRLAQMKSEGADSVYISNWEEGSRQGRETIEAYRLAREALRDLEWFHQSG